MLLPRQLLSLAPLRQSAAPDGALLWSFLKSLAASKVVVVASDLAINLSILVMDFVRQFFPPVLLFRVLAESLFL